LGAPHFCWHFNIVRWTFCVFISLSAIGVLGQERKVVHKIFDKDDGVELDIITDLVFDDDGFLWLGGTILDTREIIASDKNLVLQRFNGRTFHNIIIPEDYKVTSVEKFYKRDDGTFILKTGDNQFIHFNPFTTAFKKLNTESQFVSPIYTFEGISYFLGQTDRTLTLYGLEENLTVKALFSFTSSENKYALGNESRIIKLKNHWLFTDDHFAIKVFATDGAFVKEITADSNKKLNTNHRILWIDEVFEVDAKKALLFFDNATLHYIDEEALDIFPLEIPNNELFSANIDYVKDGNGNKLLVNEFEGTLQFNSISEEKGITTWYSNPEFKGGMALHPISLNVTEDLWIGSSTGELHYFKFPKKNVRQILSEYQFRAITQLDEKTYLLATDGHGWHKLDKNTFKTEKVNFSTETHEAFPNSSRNFIKDGNTIWSNYRSGMVETDVNKGTFSYYKHHPITSLERINDSIIFCGTRQYKLLSFNIRSKVFKEILNTDTLSMHDVAYNKEKNMFVAATSQGLLTYHTKTKEQAFYNNPNALEDTYLLMADYHPEYGFLLGSRNGTIVTFNEETKTFQTIYKDALGAGIGTILPRETIWWINTFNGYVRWHRTTNTTTRFSTRDGFSNNEANRYSALDTGKDFLIGSIAGLNYFDPDRMVPEENNAQLKLLKTRSYNDAKGKIVDVFDRSVFSETPSITLPAEFKELQLEYGLTHNTENRPHSFHYRLDGEDWVDVKQEQQIRFPSMAAGNYRLQIKALDFSGNMVGTPLQIAIHSKNFFYRTWWFYLSVVIALSSLLLYLLSKAREKQKLQEKFAVALLVSQEKERNHIAKELHDSVGQQLTLIKKKTQQKGDDDLTNLTNTVLEEVRAISRGLYPANLKLLGLSQSIEQLIYDLDEQFETFFSVDIVNVDAYFNETESLNLYRFVQECINNSMKHACAGAISVEVAEMPSEIRVEISDNGKGFEITEAQLKNSLGLKTLSERIKIIGGTLEIKSSQNKGTKTIAIIKKK